MIDINFPFSIAQIPVYATSSKIAEAYDIAQTAIVGFYMTTLEFTEGEALTGLETAKLLDVAKLSSPQGYPDLYWIEVFDLEDNPVCLWSITIDEDGRVRRGTTLIYRTATYQANWQLLGELCVSQARQWGGLYHINKADRALAHVVTETDQGDAIHLRNLRYPEYRFKPVTSEEQLAWLDMEDEWSTRLAGKQLDTASTDTLHL